MLYSYSSHSIIIKQFCLIKICGIAYNSSLNHFSCLIKFHPIIILFRDFKNVCINIYNFGLAEAFLEECSIYLFTHLIFMLFFVYFLIYHFMKLLNFIGSIKIILINFNYNYNVTLKYTNDYNV